MEGNYNAHDLAAKLARMLEKLYGVSGRGHILHRIDADYLEKDPMEALVLITAFLYAKGLQAESFDYHEIYEGYFDKLIPNSVIDLETLECFVGEVSILCKEIYERLGI